MEFFSFFVNLNLNNKIKNAKNKYMKILKGGKVMKVNECMCNDVCCVKPEDNVENVAKVMCNNHIGCVPVCDSNNCICGILTDRDIILRAIACDKDVKSTKVSDITKDTSIKVASAFKYPPNVFIKSLKCFPTLFTQSDGI